MIEQSFVEDGIKCELHRFNERDHEIVIHYLDKPEEKLSQKYSCCYPALFGRDIHDINELERITDELITKIKGQ